MSHRPIKQFCCDLNWIRQQSASGNQEVHPSMAHEWADVVPQAYLDVPPGSWAITPSSARLMPSRDMRFIPRTPVSVAPGRGQELFPRIYELDTESRVAVLVVFLRRHGSDGQQPAHRVDGAGRLRGTPLFSCPGESVDRLALRPRARVPVRLSGRLAALRRFVYGSLKPDTLAHPPAVVYGSAVSRDLRA